jgi:hypothetical protein
MSYILRSLRSIFTTTDGGDETATAAAVVDDDGGPGVARDERRRRRSLSRLQRTTGPSSNEDDDDDDDDDEENEVADASIVAASTAANAESSWRSSGRERTMTNRLSPTFKPQKRSDRGANNDSSKRQRIESSKSSTSAFERQWDHRYELLVQYKSVHGNSAMPASYKVVVSTMTEGRGGVEEEEGEEEVVILLGRWLENQKAFHKKGKLLSNRYERLVNVGVDFGEDDTTTHPSKTKTPSPPSKSYKPTPKKREGGSTTATMTPSPSKTVFSPKLEERWEKNLKLYIRGSKSNNDETHKRWIENQRSAYRAGTLTNDRHARLTNADFDFGLSKSDKWNVNMSNLISYQKSHNGSCNVPLHYIPYPKLGKWVRKQRTASKNNTLLEERYDRLNAIGFWNTLAASASPGGGGGVRWGRV